MGLFSIPRVTEAESDIYKRAARNEMIEAHEILTSMFPERVSKDEHGVIVVDLREKRQ